MTTLQLPNADAKLLHLALQLHLERPGSEIDAETGGPRSDSLAPIAEALQPQLTLAVASIDVNADQQPRLSSALAAAINQLKSLPLLAGGGQRPPAAFDAALREHFPEIAGDPDYASQVAGHMLHLRRRVDRADVHDTDTRSPGDTTSRPWWRFWSASQ